MLNILSHLTISYSKLHFVLESANLFIAVIVDASNDEAEAKARAERDGLRMRLDKLLQDVDEIKSKLKN